MTVRLAVAVLLGASACGTGGGSGTSGSGGTTGESGSGSGATTGPGESGSGGTDSSGSEGASSSETGGAPGSCPAPRVFCDQPAPECPDGTFPAAEPCAYGFCPDRCWTGECEPCAADCAADEDCSLVGRHGCCGNAGDCALGCFWAKPASVLEEDQCYFPGSCPVPAAPAACPQDCVDDDRCADCPHCAPDAARCEGGACASVWLICEPQCGCD